MTNEILHRGEPCAICDPESGLAEADAVARSPFPRQIMPARRQTGIGNVTVPDPGADLGARDYRESPSSRQSEAEGLASYDRNAPNALGTPVGPPPDHSIMSYDLPDELASYDRMGREGG